MKCDTEALNMGDEQREIYKGSKCYSSPHSQLLASCVSQDFVNTKKIKKMGRARTFFDITIGGHKGTFTSILHLPTYLHSLHMIHFARLFIHSFIYESIT